MTSVLSGETGMPKFVLMFTAAVMVLSITIAMAQPPMFENTPKTGSPTGTPAMSAEQFKNRVNTLNQQTKSNIDQELSQKLNRPQMPQPSTPATTGSTPANQNQFSNINNAPATSTTNTGAPAMSSTPPTPTSPAPASTMPSFSAPPSSSGTTNTQGNSGGWNIKY